jgi:hypothetical protein
VTKKRTVSIAAIGALVLALFPSSEGTASVASSGSIVVVAKGWTQQESVPDVTQGDISFGAVLRNRSRVHDELRVDVALDLLNKNGELAMSWERTLGVIPAGQTVYLGYFWNAVERVRRLRVSVQVGSEVKKQFVLPHVTGIRIDRGAGQVSGTFVNPYNQPLFIYSVRTLNTAVFFDRQGRVIGSGDLCDVYAGSSSLTSPNRIKPGQKATTECTIPEVIKPARIASAGMTVTLANG